MESYIEFKIKLKDINREQIKLENDFIQVTHNVICKIMNILDNPIKKYNKNSKKTTIKLYPLMVDEKDTRYSLLEIALLPKEMEEKRPHQIAIDLYSLCNLPINFIFSKNIPKSYHQKFCEMVEKELNFRLRFTYGWPKEDS